MTLTKVVVIMMQRFGDSIRRFMAGRNGVDQLCWFLLILGVILNLVGTISRITLFSALAYIPLIWTIFRTFSRNVPQRYAENQKFLQFFARIKGRKTYCYFKCPSCKTRVRVPRGKGTLRITCPSCRQQFTKKT